MSTPDRRQWSGVGLAAVVCALLGLGALYAFTVPKFLPADETSHVGYALTVADGRLPALDTEVPDEVPGMALQFEIRRQIYTANHPPLYYLPVAVPLRLGVATGHPVLGFELARLLTVTLTATGAVAVWWTARLLLPEGADLAVLAAAIAVLLPAVPRFAGVVYNDGFALGVSAVAMAVSITLLVRGPTRRLLWAAAAVASALALTRAVGIAGAGLVALSGAGAVYLHSVRPARARLGRAIGAGTLIASAALVASGWFWLHNKHRYGDIAGSAYNLARFGYGPRGSTLAILRDPHWALTLHRQLWGRIYDNGEFAVGWGALPGALVIGLIVIGAGVLAVRASRGQGRRALREARPWDAARRGRVAAWGLLVVWAGLVYVSTMGYIASGGGVHGRYLFPALPAVAVLAAAAIGALPGRRLALAPVLAVVVLVATGLVWAARFADRVAPAASWWGATMTSTASAANGVPGAFVWLAVAVTVGGTATTCTALVTLARADLSPAVGATVNNTGVDNTGDALSEPRPPDGPGHP